MLKKTNIGPPPVYRPGALPGTQAVPGGNTIKAGMILTHPSKVVNAQATFGPPPVYRPGALLGTQAVPGGNMTKAGTIPAHPSNAVSGQPGRPAANPVRTVPFAAPPATAMRQTAPAASAPPAFKCPPSTGAAPAAFKPGNVQAKFETRRFGNPNLPNLRGAWIGAPSAPVVQRAHNHDEDAAEPPNKNYFNAWREFANVCHKRWDTGGDLEHLKADAKEIEGIVGSSSAKQAANKVRDFVDTMLALAKDLKQNEIEAAAAVKKDFGITARSGPSFRQKVDLRIDMKARKAGHDPTARFASGPTEPHKQDLSGVDFGSWGI